MTLELKRTQEETRLMMKYVLRDIFNIFETGNFGTSEGGWRAENMKINRKVGLNLQFMPKSSYKR